MTMRPPRNAHCRRRDRAEAAEDAWPCRDEIEGRWRTDVVLKRDCSRPSSAAAFRGRDGEVEAVLRRIDEVPWWSFAAGAPSVRARAARAGRGRGQARHRAGAAVCRPPRAGAQLDRRRAAAHRQAHGDAGYFRSAKAALRKLHRAGICHNDLAKEQNWLRGRDGKRLSHRFPARRALSRAGPAVPHRRLRGSAAPAQAQAPLCPGSAHRRRAARAGEEEPARPASGWRPARGSTTGITRGAVPLHRSRRRRAAAGPRCAAASPRGSRRTRRCARSSIVAFPDRRAGTGLYAFVEGAAGT